MKFDDLDARLRVFETAYGYCALPGLYLVARLDGRGFTRLTKEVQAVEAPFDERMRDSAEDAFGRKLRKYQSVLAGEASAVFSLQLGAVGVFDCRLSQLPRRQAGFNPRTQTPVKTTRRHLTTNLELPLGPAYETFIRQWLPAVE